MCQALVTAAQELVDWRDAHTYSFPPTILHITAGEACDGDPEEIASKLAALSTDDGEALLFNLFVSSAKSEPVVFPETAEGLPNEFAEMLFRISSPLPESFIGAAREKHFMVGKNANSHICGADAALIVDFFDIHIRPAPLR